MRGGLIRNIFVEIFAEMVKSSDRWAWDNTRIYARFMEKRQELIAAGQVCIDASVVLPSGTRLVEFYPELNASLSKGKFDAELRVFVRDFDKISTYICNSLSEEHGDDFEKASVWQVLEKDWYPWVFKAMDTICEEDATKQKVKQGVEEERVEATTEVATA